MGEGRVLHLVVYNILHLSLSISTLFSIFTLIYLQQSRYRPFSVAMSVIADDFTAAIMPLQI